MVRERSFPCLSFAFQSLGGRGCGRESFLFGLKVEEDILDMKRMKGMEKGSRREWEGRGRVNEPGGRTMMHTYTVPVAWIGNNNAEWFWAREAWWTEGYSFLPFFFLLLKRSLVLEAHAGRGAKTPAGASGTSSR
jgi:hypothetical protein